MADPCAAAVEVSSLAHRPAGESARRRTLSARAAYGLAAAVIGLGLFASVTPSPL